MLPTRYLSIRELVFRKILKARKESKCSRLRELKLPQLHTEALHFYELIHWATEKITEPPMTMKYDDRNYRNDFFGWPFPILPKISVSHPSSGTLCKTGYNQYTESLVSVCGSEARDGFIRTRIKARKELPNFDTKCQYFREKEDLISTNKHS
ncbi:unnamed protein product [Brassicogethes aeneus]|uniref:Uncharacterized protein n=1 Tax=Brassicogethes aeneus TaxID=1431903 RepID=A0A9P0BCX4_BRAAE|nr:unnamed protein product [Brassicogethes aeneus]